MRKILFVVFILLVLAVDWAALHDIIKGEPDPWMEWTFVLCSAVLFAALCVRWVRSRA